MIITNQQENILWNAIQHYGMNEQIDKAIEEMSELIKELANKKSLIPENIKDEVADVFIMLKQLEIIFNAYDGIQNRIDFKIERLQKRLEER